MYIIRGNFFGYFIASSYSCPFLLALLLVQVPMPSFVAAAMLLVCNAYFPADPFGSPTLPLIVVSCLAVVTLVWLWLGGWACGLHWW